MQRSIGSILRYGAVMTALMLATVAAQSAAAAESSGFVQFASVDSVVRQADPANVSLASCCDTSCSGSCAASCCDPVPVCDSCCSSAGGCGGHGLAGLGCGIKDHLRGLIKPSDPCFDCFISPMTNPFFFEDPRTLTEARFIYMHNKVPLALGRGDVDPFVVQMRAAVSDRLSIIATKNGYLSSDNPFVDDGWLDINAGLKYNLLRRPKQQLLYTLGATYELPVGSHRSLQGNGDGTINLFSTLGKRFSAWNTLISKGWIIPLNDDAESSWFFLSGHVSRRLCDSNFYVLAECNWYSWTHSGSVGPNGFEGLDLFNFGSTNVKDNDIATGAFGLKYKPSRKVELGVAWENPLTQRRDVLENRLTFDCILRY